MHEGSPPPLPPLFLPSFSPLLSLFYLSERIEGEGEGEREGRGVRGWGASIIILIVFL
jgi:hypothetical protein